MKKRQRIRKALKAAKQYLAKRHTDYRSKFICYAIFDAYDHGKISYETYSDACEMIQTRIAPYGMLSKWLRDQIGDKAFSAAPVDSMQEYRHRWLDSLIEEFSK